MVGPETLLSSGYHGNRQQVSIIISFTDKRLDKNKVRTQKYLTSGYQDASILTYITPKMVGPETLLSSGYHDNR